MQAKKVYYPILSSNLSLQKGRILKANLVDVYPNKTDIHCQTKANWVATVIWVSPWFGYPHTQITSAIGNPFSYDVSNLGIHWYHPEIPRSLVIWVSLNYEIWREIFILRKMYAAKFRNLMQYVRNHEYPPGFSKQDKLILRKYAKKIEFDSKSGSLFYLDRQKDGKPLRRLVITGQRKKQRVFRECHSAKKFSRQAGRDSALQKLKERYYRPEYHKDPVDWIVRTGLSGLQV